MQRQRKKFSEYNTAGKIAFMAYGLIIPVVFYIILCKPIIPMFAHINAINVILTGICIITYIICFK
jgi:hypothetical protein